MNEEENIKKLQTSSSRGISNKIMHYAYSIHIGDIFEKIERVPILETVLTLEMKE